MPGDRYARFHGSDRAADNRNAGQRDRDRVLYTTALRRLDGVTQVAAAAEHVVFHNRLTHTLEVAQIARRLAEHLRAAQPELAGQYELDPEVAEAAALAHDLGHPPFGHVGEKQLDECVREQHNGDGFEGNAQSFRIVTKLSIRHEQFRGLNLSRASLNGVLKYPWFRETAGHRHRKFGAYRSEQREFDWAREGLGSARSVEAELMDWADDIAYSVHDLDDFVRAGIIPLDRLRSDESEFGEFVDGVMSYWRSKDGAPEVSRDELMAMRRSVIRLFPLDRPFSGSRSDRAKLRTYTSVLINRYVRGDKDSERPIALVDQASGDNSPVAIQRGARAEVDLLKEITAHYVIRHPALATMQHGERQVVRDLFAALCQDASGERQLMPIGFREILEDEERGIREPDNLVPVRARVVADVISGLTEAQALQLHGRLMGHSPGSLLDRVL